MSRLHKFIHGWVGFSLQLHSIPKDPLTFNFLVYLHKNATEIPLPTSVLSFSLLSIFFPILLRRPVVVVAGVTSAAGVGGGMAGARRLTGAGVDRDVLQQERHAKLLRHG